MRRSIRPKRASRLAELNDEDRAILLSIARRDQAHEQLLAELGRIETALEAVREISTKEKRGRAAEALPVSGMKSVTRCRRNQSGSQGLGCRSRHLQYPFHANGDRGDGGMALLYCGESGQDGRRGPCTETKRGDRRDRRSRDTAVSQHDGEIPGDG